MNRKEFFKHSGRWIILSGLGLMTAFLAANHKIVSAAECPVASQCKSCRKYGKCDFPQAKKQDYGK